MAPQREEMGGGIGMEMEMEMDTETEKDRDGNGGQREGGTCRKDKGT